MMRDRWNMVLMIAAAAFVTVISLWGPELLAAYEDAKSLNQVKEKAAEDLGEGYRYTMSNGEKLQLLSRCLNSQNQANQTLVYQNKLNYEDLEGTYAFVVNKQGPSEQEITENNIFEVCNEQLEQLYSMGVVPDKVKEVTAEAYDAVLYSAIDVLEPRNHISVWKVSLSGSKNNADKSGRVLDLYLDAQTGKIYEFYARIHTTWDKMDSDVMMEKWAEYMDLSLPEKYESENPLLENTPYFRKYRFGENGETGTVVTLGFYEGINELYLKVCK